MIATRVPAFRGLFKVETGFLGFQKSDAFRSACNFFGFDKDIRRNARQLIEVRRGNNSDIRIAVVRRMIEIIRDSVKGDFDWISHRLGRVVTLSSRPEDNAGLEDFIMRDLFPEERAR